MEKYLNLYAKQNDLTHVYFSDMPMILLLYNEAYFNTNELDSSVTSVSVSLLQEFENVFPNKIPSGLSPIREMEHQIDLVLGSAIPNRSTYKSNPEKTNEF